MNIKYLRAYLHQPDGSRRAIGYLSQYGDILRMSFDEDYIADARRPVLSLAYRGANETATREILASPQDVRLVRTDGRWPVYFENLLPEGHNRERLAAERHCSPDDEFELLAAAGHDLMGALEVEPVPPREGVPDVVHRWHTALGLEMIEPGFVDTPVEDAASLPGVVTKFSAIRDGRRYIVKRQGRAGSVILKLPTTRHPDLVENEFTGYRLCEALDLDCAKAEIISRHDADLPEQVPFEHILAVPRFDRLPDGRRVHMEEFAQVLQYPPRSKYGRGLDVDYTTMLRVLDQLSGQPVRDVREFMRRLIAFILLGNTDAHLKNWALIYPDAQTPQLAPVYDPVCVAAFFHNVPLSHYGVNRAIDKTLRAFDWPALEALLKGAGLLRVGRLMTIARETVHEAQAVWPTLLDDAPGAVKATVLERLNGGVALTA
ncbi:type II toxin-antitoxin system HipA family toxin [Pandoraea sputorum]|uniref:Serine/threonine-protein kinase HipA n=1 Tax=Pandoraea sputorum TaxID=93222 RepID=A0A239SJ34_9BURK|nr:HipA domain-containing protein [Pandoraea sputorum]AJC17194.1 regulator [Pandoraea sputorum]SNU85426.1 Serine/threonine-protein kinase HipA [Pandoraea sputorum]